MGPTVGLNALKKRKICPLLGVKPQLSIPEPLAIPTELEIMCPKVVASFHIFSKSLFTILPFDGM
jgi:hypothetical protein